MLIIEAHINKSLYSMAARKPYHYIINRKESSPLRLSYKATFILILGQEIKCIRNNNNEK